MFFIQGVGCINFRMIFDELEKNENGISNRVLQKNRNLEIQKALNGTKFLRAPGGCKQIFKKIRKYFTSYPSP